MRRAVGALIRKDLLLQRRTPEAVPAMVLFSIGTFVLFHFALDEREVSGNLASGILWVTLLFAAVLAINRLFVSEREEGGFDGIRLAPVDYTVLFAAKATALVVFMIVLELATVPVFALFFLDSAAGLAPLVIVLLLVDLGLAATGTLISCMAVHSRSRELLVPLLLLPLAIPLMIAASGATEPLLELGGPSYDRFGTWLAVLGLYDLVFLLVGYAVFDFLLED